MREGHISLSLHVCVLYKCFPREMRAQLACARWKDIIGLHLVYADCRP